MHLMKKTVIISETVFFKKNQDNGRCTKQYLVMFTVAFASTFSEVRNECTHKRTDILHNADIRTRPKGWSGSRD